MSFPENRTKRGQGVGKSIGTAKFFAMPLWSTGLPPPPIRNRENLIGFGFLVIQNVDFPTFFLKTQCVDLKVNV